MSLQDHGLTPRLRPLSTRRSATLSVLDIGTSKIVCLIAELRPAEPGEVLRGRTHLARILGVGVVLREVGAQVAVRDGTGKGIDQLVTQHVAIRVRIEAGRCRHKDTAQHQRAALHQPVHVMPRPNTERHLHAQP